MKTKKIPNTVIVNPVRPADTFPIKKLNLPSPKIKRPKQK